MSAATILKVIEQMNPAIVQDARDRIAAPLTDLTLIKPISNQFQLQDRDDRLVFIATVVRLYDPAYFVTRKALGRGIRQELASLVNCDSSTISYHADSVRHFYKYDFSFRDKVDEKCDFVLKGGKG